MSNTRADLIESIKRALDARQFVTKSRVGKGYICPQCHSGEGIHGTGAAAYYDRDNKLYCHKCGRSFDVIDLYQLANTCDFNTAVDALAAQVQSGAVETTQQAPDAHGTPKAAEQQATTEFRNNQIAAWANAMTQDTPGYRYLINRGFTPETVSKFRLGYNAQYNSVIIPYPEISGYYAARNIDSNSPNKYTFPKNTPKPLFLLSANKPPRYAYICEGQLDALAAIQAGADMAIATGGTGSADKLSDAQNLPKNLIVLSDNDTAGGIFSSKIRSKFKALGHNVYIAGKEYETMKDFAEVQEKNGAAQARKVLQAIESNAAADKKEPANTAKPENMAQYAAHFIDAIKNFPAPIKTGFKNIDEMAAAGGLYPGLYVLAAVSSLGKTTFALQLADQIAESGKDVLFFSMEQSKFELLAKSITRMNALMYPNPESCKTTSLDIRRGKHNAEVQEQLDKYIPAIGNRLSIIDGNFETNSKKIIETIKNYIRETGSKPVCFIDYIQIVRAENEDNYRMTDKERLDRLVTQLEQLSKKENLTIVAISSVNRSSYLLPLGQESLKESGGIEYTADVVWGLELTEMYNNPDKGKIENAKKENPRRVTLTCLKNRYGPLYRVNFNYYPHIDFYKDASSEDGQAQSQFIKII